MTFAKRMRGAAAFSVAMLIGCGLSVPPAQANYIVTLVQLGITSLRLVAEHLT
jgi:hypothetical protein